jgi:hypothetical protein
MPGQKCSVCTHPQSFEINEALIIQKASNRGIARQYGVGDDSVQRHRKHIPQLLLQASRSQEIADADLLLDDIATIRDKTFKVLDNAEDSEDWATMLKAIREARENVRILGELHGRLGARVETRPLISPVAMNVIVQILAPHPELAVAVADALEPLEELEAAG